MARKREHAGPGAQGQRQLRVGEVIRRALSDILARGEAHEPELDRVPLTVSEVRISPDLRQATAYVMPLGGREREAVMAALARAAPELRHLVAREVRLKYAPTLHFALDDTFDRYDATRTMLSDPAVRRDLGEDDGDED